MKKIILFSMVIFFTSLFATDVSNFDIKGIKLGMSKDEVLKLMPHGTKIDYFCIDDKINNKCKYPYEYLLNPGWLLSSNGKTCFIDLDHNSKIYKIDKTIKLSRFSKLEKVVKNVIKHYGKPDLIRKFQKAQVLCYGGCLLSKETEGNLLAITFISQLLFSPFKYKLDTLLIFWGQKIQEESNFFF